MLRSDALVEEVGVVEIFCETVRDGFGGVGNISAGDAPGDGGLEELLELSILYLSEFG